MSNNILADLQPHAVFKYFEQICAIPHGSGNVKQISDYLCDLHVREICGLSRMKVIM